MNDELKFKILAILWNYQRDIRKVKGLDGKKEFTEACQAKLDQAYQGYFLTRFTKELETMQPLMSPDGYEKFKKTALAVAERVTT